jgi:hypothetical protein
MDLRECGIVRPDGAGPSLYTHFHKAFTKLSME